MRNHKLQNDGKILILTLILELIPPSFTLQSIDTTSTSTDTTSESSIDESLTTPSELSSPPQPLNIDNNELPDTRRILNSVDSLPDNDPNKIAWLSLINHNCESKFGDINDWYPFGNELCFLLFVGRYDPDRAITREIITFFCSILHTLKQNGHLNGEYFVPKNGNVIETWWKHLPTPPMRMFFILIVFIYPCTSCLVQYE